MGVNDNALSAALDALKIATGASNSNSLAETGPTPAGRQDTGFTPFRPGGGNTIINMGGGGGSSYNKQQAINNLQALLGYNRDTVLGNDRNLKSVYDVADEQSRNLANQQMEQAAQKAGGDRWLRRGDLLNVGEQLRDVAGNAFAGSARNDFWDLMSSQSDKDETLTLQTLRGNRGDIQNSLFEALSGTRNSRNQLSADTENSLREMFADFAAQANNIDPDIAAQWFNIPSHTLNLLDWYSDKFFEENKLPAMKTTPVPLSRSGMDTTKANAIKNTGERNTSSSSDPSERYRKYLQSSYERRDY